MSEKILLIDVDKCVGCYACEIACKQEHDLQVGPRWCRVISIGPRNVHGSLHLDSVPTICIQCADPACASFCPVGAIGKREDGIVVIDENACTGCKLCEYGCPYGAIYFDEDKKVAGKCTLCLSRIRDGLEPSCVQNCIGGALQFVTEDELDHIIKGMHRARTDRVCYTSSKWKLSLNL